MNYIENTLNKLLIESEDAAVSISIDTEDELCLFKLGYLFSQGKCIRIKNELEVKEKVKEEYECGNYKTYYMSSLYWAINKKKFNFKSSPLKTNSFIICPVARATINQRMEIEKFIKKMVDRGIAVYYPARDTNQSPYEDGMYTGGYNINCQNAIAIGKSSKIFIFYDRKSRGLFFDLGVVYSHILQQPHIEVCVINKHEINPLLYPDKILLSIISKNKQIWDFMGGKK